MTARQCEIAAEAYAAHLLARCGYDVLVQYGPGQPKFDLVAVRTNKVGKPERTLHVSVKGGQTGGWLLAAKKSNQNYIQSINEWIEAQSEEIVFIFIEFSNTKIGEAPRAYVARPKEIADHLITQSEGRGWGALRENTQRNHPRSKLEDKIPCAWVFSKERLDQI